MTSVANIFRLYGPDYRAASLIYRAKFRAAMERCGLASEIPTSVWGEAWVVHSQAVGDGRHALGYLAAGIPPNCLKREKVGTSSP